MERDQSRLVVLFAALSHALFHVVAGLFLTLVLVIEPVWKLPYAQLIELWTIGALLLGLGAPVAGWLADRLGETRLMIGFLIGMGASGVAAGLAEAPAGLQLALAAMGLFGAVYHPVGTAWVVRHARERGRSIAIVGIAGSAGIALSSLVAGGLADFAGWRIAFAVPSLAMIALGLALLAVYRSGRAADRVTDASPVAAASRADVRRAFQVLVVTMTLTSVTYQAFATMLPKWIEREIGSALGQGLSGIGLLVAVIYLAGTLGQWIGGWLADRGLERLSYVASFALLLPATFAGAMISGWPIVLAAVAVVLILDQASLIENLLIARYTRASRRGFAYGVRYGIGIIAGPLGVQMVARLFDPTAGFATLLQVLAGLALILLIAALFLPSADAEAPVATGAATGRAPGGA